MQGQDEKPTSQPAGILQGLELETARNHHYELLSYLLI